ncbi:MAG: hypothetical protein IBV52_09490 [Candidatus Bathyarchaeota archaeon]
MKPIGWVEGDKMFKRLWPGLVGSFIAGAAIMYVVAPYLAPVIARWLNPKGSLYVSVKLVERPEEVVPGKDLSQLVLLSGDQIVSIAYPKKGWHEWDNLQGYYVVKAYINDMYAGQTKVEVKPREKKRAEITTELAQSIIQIEVMANKGKNPVKNALVEIVSHIGILYRSELTDSNGETNEIMLARTAGKNEYYDIYVYQKKDSKKSLIANSERVKINKPREKFTLGVP